MERTTSSGWCRRKGLSAAGLGLLFLVAVAFSAAAQTTPPAEKPVKEPAMGMAAMKGHAPGMAAGMGSCGAMCCAQGGMRKHLMMRGGRAGMPDMVQRLLTAADKIGLSDAQKNQLRAIRRGTPAALMPKRQALMEARIDLQDVQAKKDATAADLRKAHDKLLKAQSDLRAAAFDLHLQLRDVLTPEQRDKLHKEMRMQKQPGGPGRMGMLDPGDEGDEGPEFEF